MSTATPTLALREEVKRHMTEPWAPRRRLQEGDNAGAPPPPDPKIRVSPRATQWGMRTATTPSKRERTSPPPVRPKKERVFTPATIHRRRTPHPGYHAVHTAMATGQHRATGSAHEHHGPTTRAAAPASKTFTTTPEIRRYPHQRHERKGPVFRTLGPPPVPRPGRPAETGLHRLVLRHRA